MGDPVIDKDDIPGPYLEYLVIQGKFTLSLKDEKDLSVRMDLERLALECPGIPVRMFADDPPDPPAECRKTLFFQEQSFIPLPCGSPPYAEA